MSASAYPGVHAAILAAGPSTRFGSPKQLVRLAGSPVLHQAITNAGLVAGHSVTVVLGAHARTSASIAAVGRRGRRESRLGGRNCELDTHRCARGATWVRRPDARPRRPGGRDGDDLKRLYAAWRRHPVLIATALYGGAPGLPAIFPRWAFSDLLQVRGDRDPRLVIRRNVDRVVRVPMQNAGIDLDTPEDLLEIEAAVSRTEL